MRTLKAFSALLLLAILAVSGNRASAQANIIENQSTYVYVDVSLGSDSNSGAQTKPFKTLQAGINKAITLNQQNIGVKVIVNSGVYRESIQIGNSKATRAPFTIQAAVTGGAVVSGADVVHGWTQQNSTTWQAPFSDTAGFCPVPSGWPAGFAPIIQRTEMVFVNGMPLTQVMAHTDLKPGTFFFSDAYQMLHISPPTGTNMSTATVEAAVRPTTFTAIGRYNFVVRGLVFRHAANCLNTSSANIFGSTQVLIDSVQAVWNNWGGLGVYTSNNFTVQNSVASYNGGAGILGDQDKYSLFKFNETDYNNWRGAQGAFYDWAMGGTKLFQMRTSTVQNHFSYNNQAQGLWFDTDNQNVTIDNSTIVGNVTAGLQIERDEGPVTVQNSHFCSSGQGINVLTSPKLVIKNNTFYNNSGTNKYQAEIFIAGHAGGKIINDYITGQAYNLFTTGMVLTGNAFQNASSGQLVFGTYLGGNDWTQFATTLNAGNNTWYDPATANSFKIVNGKIVNLAGWQSAVQTDYSSVWKSPAASPASYCTAPTPTYTDFRVTVESNNYAMSGAKAVATARVTSFGYGTVSLRLTGVPAGVTATISQSSLMSGAATITFNATSTAAMQRVPVTLWASSGSRVHSVTFYVNVSAT
jgi:Right handed beta helix region